MSHRKKDRSKIEARRSRNQPFNKEALEEDLRALNEKMKGLSFEERLALQDEDAKKHGGWVEFCCPGCGYGSFTGHDLFKVYKWTCPNCGAVIEGWRKRLEDPMV